MYRCLYLVVVSLLAGCATPLTVADLAPPINACECTATGKSLTVGNVTGKEQKDTTGLLTISVKAELFRDTLVEALKSSRMFRTVSTGPGGDYTLDAQIVTQDLQGVGTDNTFTLIVRYDLRESASKKLIWSGLEVSEERLSSAQVFMGLERSKRLKQMVFRDNLSKLMLALNKALSATRASKQS